MPKNDPADKAMAQLLSGLRGLIREEIAAARPEDDPLIPHHEAPFGRRKTLRLIHAGKLHATKTSKTSRVYYIRQSAIDALVEEQPADIEPPKGEEPVDEIDAILLGTPRGRK